MKTTGRKIILGSASPRRRQLLEELFGNIEVRVNHLSEEFPTHLREGEIPVFLAEQKAASHTLTDGELLITADTIVWFDGKVLNKPRDRAEALDMLKMLAGRKHEVFTGFCISGTENRGTCAVKSVVEFRPAEEPELAAYIQTYSPFDKAGSYGAQECLPEGMNPLSDEEKKFLLRAGKPDLFERSLSVKAGAHFPLIKKIEGSYFNVMGLPLVELAALLQSEFGERYF